MAVKLDNDKCNGCGKCKRVCPADAVDIKNGKAVINESCIECVACVSECPQGALTFREKNTPN